MGSVRGFLCRIIIGRTSWLVRFSRVSFLIATIYWIGTIIIISKRSASSVPTAAERARLNRRMDSPVSRSDISSEPGEGSDCDLMAPLPLSCVYAAPPFVGPVSSVERASSYIPGEIAVYEAFFDSGLRGTIPALIVGLCNLFEISPSQLNPPAWRILVAIQNLGDLEYLSLGVNEILDIGKLNDQHDFQEAGSTSIDRFRMTSLDGKKPTEYLPYTAAAVDQITSKLYTAIDNMEERFEKRCDDIYFPFDVKLSGLDSQAECLHKEVKAIQRQLASQHQISASMTEQTPNQSTVLHQQRSIDTWLHRSIPPYAYSKI
ncbi:BnaA10g28810D [Brassica napus]|uniref:BnaA10g28810D protein n=1 Tax=Brassica napus TaxID=3708 RepID=A0A078JFU1_BRANA|nr:BnaA10g28810D [Brassica napus]